MSSQLTGVRSIVAGLVLAVALLIPQPAAAQETPDWTVVYKRARTANYISYAAPAAGLGLGIPLIAKATQGNVLDAIIFGALGFLAIGGGVTAGAPLQAWSGMRGARALKELGHPVSRIPGYIAWGGSAVSASGVALLVADSYIGDGEGDGDVLEVALIAMLLGFPITYGAGLVQWGVNRKGWQGGARPEPMMIRVGARW